MSEYAVLIHANGTWQRVTLRTEEDAQELYAVLRDNGYAVQAVEFTPAERVF